MKKLILAAVVVTLIGAQTAGAQSMQFTKGSKSTEIVTASQTNAAKQHAAVLDKLQQETEDLMLAITPAPLVSLAQLINQKLSNNKQHKAAARKERMDLNLTDL
ncbi:MAG: hypothetical protein K1X61_10865 [Chitinophagales bacterium]|nr:hypothetical protein [Chitinophagales bacterium]